MERMAAQSVLKESPEEVPSVLTPVGQFNRCFRCALDAPESSLAESRCRLTYWPASHQPCFQNR
eukprot:5208523-Alexandrium_andersonii.AAC.1